MVVQSLRKQGPRPSNCVGSTVIYDTSHAWRYMYSASDASKRRSLSICILMVLSAFDRYPQSGHHDEEEMTGKKMAHTSSLEELEGSWQILEPYEMTDLDDGTYEQVEYIDLDGVELHPELVGVRNQP